MVRGQEDGVLSGMSSSIRFAIGVVVVLCFVGAMAGWWLAGAIVREGICWPTAVLCGVLVAAWCIARKMLC